MFNEAALIKYNRRAVSLTRGSPTQVEFDWMALYNLRLSLGKEFNPDLVSFYHVHPENFLQYSSLDVECLEGFNTALGFPVFFSIITFDDGSDYDNFLYREKAFRLVEGEMVEQDAYGRFDLRLSMLDTVALKAVSYARKVS